MGLTDDEKGWILASQNGDHAAFEQLIKTHQTMIHSLTFRMTGSMADAQDLAQESFIQAYEQLAHFRGESAFSSWLYRIAVNLCLNWHKRERRRGKLRENWDPQPPAEALNESLKQRVQEALARLHPKQRAAVVLTIYDGCSHADAARILGCSETTASWRVFAARRKLKRWLAVDKGGQ